ncbi:TraR/DksA family transcriptional regulator [Bacillus marasmi]|uniref:TraR/DksA family transcriptional regulator n=1 Tax=Bacillus marasmi TaxID=1926279 RepID=UPI0011CC3EA2|nr:hypothetical protein [Bacillus marasmi]
MEAKLAKLYTELRTTSEELLKRMESSNGSNEIQEILKEELNDIEATMVKIKTGQYGICEMSGEMIPAEVLKIMPTIKSLKDIEGLNSFFRKPINTI